MILVFGTSIVSQTDSTANNGPQKMEAIRITEPRILSQIVLFVSGSTQITDEVRRFFIADVRINP